MHRIQFRKQKKKIKHFQRDKDIFFFCFFFSLADLMLTAALGKALSHCKT